MVNKETQSERIANVIIKDIKKLAIYMAKNQDKLLYKEKKDLKEWLEFLITKLELKQILKPSNKIEL